MENWLGRGSLFFIVVFGGILSLQYTTSHFKSDRQIVLLNTTRPDFYQLLNLEEQPTSSSLKSNLREYSEYFHLVTEAMPDNSDGLLMLGYLDIISGHEDQAMPVLTKAYRLNPQSFFIGYDLAFVDFHKGQYGQSTELLQRVLTLTPQDTLNQMMTSIVYRQVLASMKDSHGIITGLQQAYHDANVLLIESLEKQKGLQGENVELPQVHAHIM